MKKFFLFAATALFALTASAQTNETMRVNLTDGTSVEYPVSDISSVDFRYAEAITPTLTDLGGEANSYVVSSAGSYKFRATHVDGTAIKDIASATWLWREKAEAPLISNVAYADGTVSFTAGATEGNAVIAAVNAKGTVVWIWHIWLTDQPSVMVYPNGCSVMDRNLGAVSARDTDGRDTWGLTYQYGRNVPFYYIGDNQEYSQTEAFDQARAFTEVNPELGLKWEVNVTGDATGWDEATSMAHPLTHHMRDYRSGTLAGYHWVSDACALQLTWGNQDITSKTNYDPCPAGYKVPLAEDLADLKNITWDNTQSGNMEYAIPGFYVENNGQKQWWPMNCGRNYEDGCALFGGQSKEYSDRLFLWTAYAGKYAPNVMQRFEYVPLRIIVQNDYVKGGLTSYIPTAGTGAFSLPVRCIREELPIQPIDAPKAGQTAPDFALTLADGTASSLREQLAKGHYTLVYFNNPDCPACHQTAAALQRSAALKSHLADGSLSILSVYTDEDTALWQRAAGQYPASWTIARDTQLSVITRGLFDMSRTPSLYLLDAEGNIILADADLPAIEALIK